MRSAWCWAAWSWRRWAACSSAAADGLLRVPRAVFGERRYDEVVLLDERLARLRLGAGGNALEALRYLLTASGVPTRTISVNARTLADEGTAGRALIVLDRASVPTVEDGARLTPLLDAWIDAEDGPTGAMLFRVEGAAPRYLLDEGSLRAYAASGI